MLGLLLEVEWSRGEERVSVEEQILASELASAEVEVEESLVLRIQVPLSAGELAVGVVELVVEEEEAAEEGKDQVSEGAMERRRKNLPVVVEQLEVEDLVSSPVVAEWLVLAAVEVEVSPVLAHRTLAPLSAVALEFVEQAWVVVEEAVGEGAEETFQLS